MNSDFQIEVVKGTCSNHIFDAVAPCLIGRSHICNVRIKEPDVSGRHIMIQSDDSGRLMLQNLSQGLTVVNGVRLACGEETNVTSETVVLLGNNTQLRIICPEQAVPEEDEDATVFFNDLAEMSTQCTSDESKSDFKTNTLSFVVEQNGDMTSCTTEEMMTRIATADEIDMLRKKANNSYLKKIGLGGGLVLIIAMILAAWWFLSAFRQEVVLNYPLNSDGIPNDEVIFPCQELGRNLFFYLPKHSSMKIVKKNNYFSAETRIGILRNVPLRLEYFAQASMDVLLNTREKGFENWINRRVAEKGGWNFGEISKVKFRGLNNGFPYLTASYSRKDSKGTWFGIASCLKFRNWQFILLKEIPLKERWRGESLLEAVPFFSVSPDIISRVWDVNIPLLDLPAKDLLDRSKLMLARITPGLWNQVYQLLVSASVKAYKMNNYEMIDQAELLFVEMRNMQLQWLNAQRIEYMNSLAKGNYKSANRIRANCKHVFIDKNDQWTHYVINNFGD